MFEKAKGILCFFIREQAEPSLGIIDAGSVRTIHHVDFYCGIGGDKKIEGRKSTLLSMRFDFR